VIRIQGLRKSFGGQPVLRGVDLDVATGEIMIIIGRSGGGKSVLLKHLLGLLRPDAGAVLVDGMDITRLRGAALEAVMQACDIIAYFDDDYIPSSYCVEGIDDFFRMHPDVAAANGMLLADGINSAGIPYEEATELVSRHDNRPRAQGVVLHELNGLYGCNMVFRAKAISEERFDEQLPLYAWQEDIDFSARVGRHGRLVKTNAFHGVHQGMKGARLSGVRLGYSQVVNPTLFALSQDHGSRSPAP